VKGKLGRRRQIGLRVKEGEGTGGEERRGEERRGEERRWETI